VFVLHAIDEVAMPEVAEALEIPLNTAYSRYRLAKEAFTKSLRRAKLGGLP
jgi:RNA polymerase sigma-70 factor (ECF subfamily)